MSSRLKLENFKAWRHADVQSRSIYEEPLGASAIPDNARSRASASATRASAACRALSDSSRAACVASRSASACRRASCSTAPCPILRRHFTSPVSGRRHRRRGTTRSSGLSKATLEKSGSKYFRLLAEDGSPESVSVVDRDGFPRILQSRLGDERPHSARHSGSGIQCPGVGPMQWVRRLVGLGFRPLSVAVPSAPNSSGSVHPLPSWSGAIAAWRTVRRLLLVYSFFLSTSFQFGFHATAIQWILHSRSPATAWFPSVHSSRSPTTSIPPRLSESPSSRRLHRPH